MNDQRTLFIKMALDGWSGQLNFTNTLLDKLSDEQLMGEVALGRNRGIYLLGHLTAVHDLMLPLLRFQEVMFPELKVLFIDAPDTSGASLPAVAQLRDQWRQVNDTLMGHLQRLPADEWFTRHASISEEDFPKEPHRNRLNVVLGRTSHLSYHRGQLVFLGR